MAVMWAMLLRWLKLSKKKILKRKTYLKPKQCHWTLSGLVFVFVMEVGRLVESGSDVDDAAVDDAVINSGGRVGPWP